MNSTLKEQIDTASTAIRTQGQKAFKHPITSILSFCLVAGIAATIAGFSQAPTETAVDAVIPTATTPETTPETAPAPAGTTLPVSRTLTSTDGRTIDVTILSKSPTAIKAARADGKEFEITLNKLSDADREFVAGLADTPVKKPTMLSLSGLTGIDEGMTKAGFDVTALTTIDELKAMTDQELESFDVVMVAVAGLSIYWDQHPVHIRIKEDTDNYIQRERILKLVVTGKVVAWRGYYKTSKAEFLKHKRVPTLSKGNGLQKDQEAFVQVEGNTIFFSWTSRIDTDGESKSSKKRDTGGEVRHPEIFDQVVVELKRLVQRKNSIQKKANN